MSEESGGESFSNALNSNLENDWDVYDREFPPKHFKDPQVGPDFQITDAMPTGEEGEVKPDLSAEVWDPDKITEENLGKCQL